MAAMYFLSYALMATAAVIVVGWAQHSRYKSEGTPVNLTILKAISGIALSMWVGAALTSVAYDSDMSLIAGSVIGLLFIVFFAWQMHQVARKMADDEKQLKELATRDSLTNLWNRRVFHELLDSEVCRARRYKLPLAVLMLSVDNLNEVNEQHGYKIGDGVLRQLGKLLDGMTRVPDNVCRFRGEIISIILPMTPLSNAEFFANRLREAVADRTFSVGDADDITITASVGVSAFGGHIDTDTTLVESGRAALATAMQQGRNSVSVCPRAQESFNQAQQANDDTAAGMEPTLQPAE